jgi:hypothetical protein
MDLNLIDQYGLPVAITIAFGYYIWKQNQFLQKELMTELEQDFTRLEMIVIKLIDQQKLTQMDIKELKGYMQGIERILTKITRANLKK